ncbi:hypothetical protein NDU88_003866 [Pleurodeles waltl]|uniref:Uncharacterized protein n=1 Tax=Pleurodeles waltl TaxID=8319 RepID=A0AAV7UDD2_PLEWA|nr:hypothetical protein NDU88_003866 [Pleurodeles waltl]
MPMPVAWALQGPPGAPRPPLPPSGSRRSDRRDLDGGRGGRNPLGGAASCAAVEDSMGRRYTGGSPPVVPVRQRSESPLEHRRPVGGAPAVLRPGGL